MKLISYLKVLPFLILALASINTSASTNGFFSSISSYVEKTLTEHSVKPFVIAIEQGK